MPDPGFPDNVRDFDHDPRSPFYHDPLREDQAEREERFASAADVIEALCYWLGDKWDQHPEDMREDEDAVAEIERIEAALTAALKPWAEDALNRIAASRRKHGASELMRLFGQTLPIVRRTAP